MTPDVEAAINELRRDFAGHQIDVEDEPQGGAYVIVHDLPLGDQYAPPCSWVGFLIHFQYPRSDIYPHFIDASVTRVDGKGWGGGISGPTDWRDRKVLQISRKSNHWNPNTDSAALKLAKVLEWLKQK